MCGRFTLRRDVEAVRRELRVEASGGAILWKARYNVSPIDQLTVQGSALTALRCGGRRLAGLALSTEGGSQV